MRSLQDLSLGGNQHTGPLPAEWSALRALKKLKLGGNKLTGPLPASWSALKNLEELDLGGNQLTGQLPAGWSVLASLQELDLSKNALTGQLPAAWGALKKLEELDLVKNKVGHCVKSVHVIHAACTVGPKLCVQHVCVCSCVVIHFAASLLYGATGKPLVALRPWKCRSQMPTCAA